MKDIDFSRNSTILLIQNSEEKAKFQKNSFQNLMPFMKTCLITFPRSISSLSASIQSRTLKKLQTSNLNLKIQVMTKSLMTSWRTFIQCSKLTVFITVMLKHLKRERTKTRKYQSLNKSNLKEDSNSSRNEMKSTYQIQAQIHKVKGTWKNRLVTIRKVCKINKHFATKLTMNYKTLILCQPSNYSFSQITSIIQTVQGYIFPTRSISKAILTTFSISILKWIHLRAKSKWLKWGKSKFLRMRIKIEILVMLIKEPGLAIRATCKCNLINNCHQIV